MFIIRIKKRDVYYLLLGTLSFCSTIRSIRYMRMNIAFISAFSALCLGIALIGGIISFFRNIKRVTPVLWLMLFYFFYLFVVTLTKTGQLTEYLAVIGTVLCFYLLITGAKYKEDLIVLLKTWCFGCFILLVLDLISMVLYPNGLYSGDTSYYINWFLGFKTERLYYTLPLLILYTYLTLINDEKMANRNKLLLLSILILIDSAISQGTSGTIALILYIICIPFIGVFNVKKQNVFTRAINKMVLWISNFYIFMVAYAFIFITLIVTQSNMRLINSIATLTGKSITFSGRLPIWTSAFKFINEHLLFGTGMIDYSEYQIITQGYNNPHNIVLTYLITGGLLGTIMLVIIIYFEFKSVKIERSKLALVLGTVVYLILGIASSSLAFCPFFFAVIILALINTGMNTGYRNL